VLIGRVIEDVMRHDRKMPISSAAAVSVMTTLRVN